MKTRIIFFLVPLFCATHGFAQSRTRPMEERTVAPVAGTKNMLTAHEEKPPAPLPPTNIKSVLLDIQNGDDGKERHTYVTYDVEDNNQRVAATNYDGPKTDIQAIAAHFNANAGPNDEYIAGSSISLPIPTQMSIPTCQMTKIGNLPIPVLRYATVADFSNGGELKITIYPSDSHDDVWKIQTITARITFENDPHSPHIVRWSNIILSSQGSPVRELFFDNNYKPL